MNYHDYFVYKDGFLVWKNCPLKKYTNQIAGSLRFDGYVGIYLNKKYHFAHRIIWEMHNEKIPEGMIVDHINNDRSDNRIENLRLATLSQNGFNRPRQQNNKSGYKRVSWHKQKQKWVAQIKINGKNKFLGFFVNAEDAYEAYCLKAKELYGEFAQL